MYKKVYIFSVKRDKFIPTCDVNIHTRNESKDKMAMVKYFFRTFGATCEKWNL
jgi:hypothetical protein